MKDDEMDETCGTNDGDEKCLQNFSQQTWKEGITWKM
jgi:hypothetical protein